MQFNWNIINDTVYTVENLIQIACFDVSLLWSITHGKCVKILSKQRLNAQTKQKNMKSNNHEECMDHQRFTI